MGNNSGMNHAATSGLNGKKELVVIIAMVMVNIFRLYTHV